MENKVLLLRSMAEMPTVTQRELAALTGCSLGTVNHLTAELRDEGLTETVRRRTRAGSVEDPEEPGDEQPLEGNEAVGKEAVGKEAVGKEKGSGRDGEKTKTVTENRVTKKGYDYLKPYRTERALILAAGFGSRFVPLSFETPKGLLEVFGEPMIERQIRQLKEAGVEEIAIAVGYRKESFEYLKDKFGVKLIYNPEYARKNTLSTIYRSRDFLAGHNCYVLSSDNWLRTNLFHRYEGGAWYAAAYSEGPTAEWTLETDRKGRITDTYPGGSDCFYMYGPVYFSREFSAVFLRALEHYYEMPGTEQFYWEHVLMEILNGTAKKRLTVRFGPLEAQKCTQGLEMYINRQQPDTIYEFEDLEELRRFDEKYVNDSGSKAMQLVSRVFGVPEGKIRRIRRLKAGMTNNSWLFEVEGQEYICRIPGEGTQLLISRHQEKAVFEAVKPLDITEEVVYFDEDPGYKISRFYTDSRTADPENPADMRVCMEKLAVLHRSGLQVAHSFDILERIGFYETLCLKETPAAGDLFEAIPFRDYRQKRLLTEKLKDYLDGLDRPRVLAHIDPVADNFIFLEGAELSEEERDGSKIRLIDWEYAGMADPLIDPAMCAIYSYMDEKKALQLLTWYLGRAPREEEKRILFAYMALGGLLWSLWGVYKEKLGVEFSEYTLKMYAYFKEYAGKCLDLEPLCP